MTVSDKSSGKQFHSANTTCFRVQLLTKFLILLVSNQELKV